MDKEIWLKPKRTCNIGGEALMEGVMMRGNRTVVTTIRKSSGEFVYYPDLYTHNKAP